MMRIYVELVLAFEKFNPFALAIIVKKLMLGTE